MPTNGDTLRRPKKVLFLFDVDGTLTQSRQKITPEMEGFMAGLKGRVSLAIVGGSDYPKIVEQLGSSEKEVLGLYDFVFAENGLNGFQGGRPLPEETLIHYLGEDKHNEIIDFCLRYFSELKIPKKRGNFIECRKGMLNVSPIGRSCSQKERDEFVELEVTLPIRAQFVKALQERFSNNGLQFSIGGQISVDIFPEGWDKSYCLKYLNDFDEIHFFGDKTFAGGNDYEIFVHERTIGYTVKSPTETRQIVEKLLKELGL